MIELTENEKEQLLAFLQSGAFTVFSRLLAEKIESFDAEEYVPSDIKGILIREQNFGARKALRELIPSLKHATT